MQKEITVHIDSPQADIESYSFTVPIGITVFELKNAIMRKDGQTVFIKQLSYKGKIMKDGNALEGYRVQHNDTLDLEWLTPRGYRATNALVPFKQEADTEVVDGETYYKGHIVTNFYNKDGSKFFYRIDDHEGKRFCKQRGGMFIEKGYDAIRDGVDGMLKNRSLEGKKKKK